MVIKLGIEIGDIILGGKFKNKRTKVKTIGKDELGQPTINGKSVLKFRIEKLLPKEKQSKATRDGVQESAAMKITKTELAQLIREAVFEQIEISDVLQQDLGKEGKEVLERFVQALSETGQAWYDLHHWFDPSPEAANAMVEEMKKESNFVDDNLLAWLEAVKTRAKTDS